MFKGKVYKLQTEFKNEISSDDVFKLEIKYKNIKIPFQTETIIIK